MRELYNMKTVHECPLGQWNRCWGYLLSPPGDGADLPAPAALQRDVDLPEVPCSLPVSTNVRGILQCPTRFLFQQLIHCRIPVFLELWDPALKFWFILPSKQWRGESIACETGRIFFSPISRSPPVQQSGSFRGISGWLSCSFSTVLE